jgi:hypothetical protein
MSHKPIIAKDGGGGKDFEPVPAGTHFAICTRVIYLGIQPIEYQGELKEQPKVWLQFEVPEFQIEYKKGDQIIKGPATIGREFTLNIGAKSNLGPFLENWRGKGFDEKELAGFDISSLLGKVCNLGVIHETKKGKTYANISSAGSLMKIQKDAIAAGTLDPKPKSELLVFNADEPDLAVLEKLPRFLQEKFAKRITTTKSGKPQKEVVAAGEDFDDEIPF